MRTAKRKRRGGFEFVGGGGVGVGEIFFEHVGDGGGEGFVGEEEGHFEVEAEGTVVEVGRADGGEVVVDDRTFWWRKPAV